MHLRENEFYYQGYEAHRQGCFYQSNPFREGSDSKMHWQRGWIAAENDARNLHAKLTHDIKACSDSKGKESPAPAVPQWDGNGIPPVGCEVEAMFPHKPAQGWVWRRVKVVLCGAPGSERECLVYDIETTLPSWVDEFRPVNEANRKRSEAVEFINENMNDMNDVLAGQIYDLIASGKVPHVRVEG